MSWQPWAQPTRQGCLQDVMGCQRTLAVRLVCLGARGCASSVVLITHVKHLISQAGWNDVIVLSCLVLSALLKAVPQLWPNDGDTMVAGSQWRDIVCAHVSSRPTQAYSKAQLPAGRNKSRLKVWVCVGGVGGWWTDIQSALMTRWCRFTDDCHQKSHAWLSLVSTPAALTCTCKKQQLKKQQPQ